MSNEIYWNVENLTTKKNKYRKLSDMEKEPPQLVFYDEDGEELISLQLTEYTNKELLENLQQVKQAYNGATYPTKSEGIIGKIKGIPRAIKENPIIGTYILIAVVLFLIYKFI